WSQSVIVDGTTYDEFIDGSWVIDFGGSLDASIDNVALTATVNYDISTETTSNNIEVTGTAFASALISHLRVMVTGSTTVDFSSGNAVILEDTTTRTCSGAILITEGGESSTCTITSDCSGCQ
ncbi:MAG: hypothetical protein WC690_08855, partial [bacterium]